MCITPFSTAAAQPAAGVPTPLDIDHAIERHGSPDKGALLGIVRACGMRGTLAWRNAWFDQARQG